MSCFFSSPRRIEAGRPGSTMNSLGVFNVLVNEHYLLKERVRIGQNSPRNEGQKLRVSPIEKLSAVALFTWRALPTALTSTRIVILRSLMAGHPLITDAQRAMASALLWHFEDDDVRIENAKLRAELISSQQERARLEEETRGLVANVVAAGQEQEKAQLETTAWRNYIIKLNGMITSLLGEDKPPPNEKLDDTIIRRIRHCCVTLKQVSATYKTMATENAALQARVAELEQLPPAPLAPPPPSTSPTPTIIPSRPQENDAMLPVEQDRPAGSDSAPSSRQVARAVDVNNPTSPPLPTASLGASHPSVSQPGPSPTPGQSSRTPASADPTHPLSVPTPSAPSVSQSSASHPQPGPTMPKKPAHCQCPPFVALSPAQSAALNQLAEPTRARDWIQAVFDTPSISQQEVYNAYQALGPAVDALHPVHLFALFKTVFPAATTVRTEGPRGEAAYMMCGIARKRAPCVCGLRKT